MTVKEQSKAKTNPKSALNQTWKKKIQTYKDVSLLEKEKILEDVVNLMSGYIKNISVKYASTSRIPYEDYYQASATNIIKHFDKFKVSSKFTIKQLESYLYYWIIDACNTERCELEYAFSISYTGYLNKKKNKVLIPTAESLDSLVKADSDGRKTSFQETLASVDNFYNPWMKKNIMENFKKTISQHFGERYYNIFMTKFINGRKVSPYQEKMCNAICSFVRNDKNLTESLYQLASL